MAAMPGVPWRALAGATLLGLALWCFCSPMMRRAPGPCQLDDEGSWSIGLFRGPSPLNLTPIEHTVPRLDGHTAWPLANPILTCASVTDAPSNFVADPFLWVQPGGAWYIFFETKSNTNMQGDIGVAASTDGGATWTYLGLALDEPFHVSYPFVFEWNGQMYMLPEAFGSGGLRLYRAKRFPLEWELERVLVDRPLVDTSLVEWEGRWWMFTSDFKSRHDLEVHYADSPLGPWHPHAANPVMSGSKRTGARMGGRVVPHEGKLLRFGQDCGDTYGHRVVAYRIDSLTPSEFQQTHVSLEFGQSLKGPAAWNGERQHHLDAHPLPDGSWVAVMDGDSQFSGPVTGRLKRAALLCALWLAVVGVACAAYVRRAGSWALPSFSYTELRSSKESDKAWARGLLELRHCLASAVVARLAGVLPEGAAGGGRRYVAVGGGSPPRTRPPSPPNSYHRGEGKDAPGGGYSAPAGAFPLTGALGGSGSGGKGGGVLEACRRTYARWVQDVCRRLRLDPGSRAGRCAGALAALLAVAAVVGTVSTVVGNAYFLSIWWDRPSSATAVAVGGEYSKFTLMVMTYEPRLPILKMYVQHYSKCPSVAEIVVVWNAGTPPDVDRDLPGSRVPVRLRVEGANSLNNRFKPDPLLSTRAVFMLDDDILLRCTDVEAGFAAWREHPDRLVGYYPRVVRTEPEVEYWAGAYTFKEGEYNAVLTGAAFMDAERIFPLYWSGANEAARAAVDNMHNCEDLLLNFLLADEARRGNRTFALPRILTSLLGSGGGGERPDPPPTVLYVEPSRRLDIAHLSGVGISKDLKPHMARRVVCIAEFGRMFGRNPLVSLDLTGRRYDQGWWLRKALKFTFDPNFYLARLLDRLARSWGQRP